MTARTIAVVGSINADLGLRVTRHPRPGETLPGTGGGVTPGGKGANQAVAAARLGAHVVMVGAVGADAHASPALTGLRDAGVDLTAVVAHEDLPTGLAVVTVADDGENSIVVVPGANARVDADAVRASADAIRDAAAVVLQGEIPRSGIEAAARACTGRLVLNPAPVLDLDPEVIRAADPLIVNEHEAAGVLAQLLPAGERIPAEPAERIRALAAQGVRSVVLTLGSRGALVLENADAPLREIPAARVKAVDTTGAGDAFIGALAAEIVTGASLADAARFASRVAAYSVTSTGAQPSYPHPDDPLPAIPEEDTP